MIDCTGRILHTVWESDRAARLRAAAAYRLRGVLAPWIADMGKLSSGAGDWPLLHEGGLDLFEGVLFGPTQRGLVINAPLIEAN